MAGPDDRNADTFGASGSASEYSLLALPGPASEFSVSPERFTQRRIRAGGKWGQDDGFVGVEIEHGSQVPFSSMSSSLFSQWNVKERFASVLLRGPGMPRASSGLFECIRQGSTCFDAFAAVHCRGNTC